jgi:DNA (cytosine-5)-methyltransferase 1
MLRVGTDFSGIGAPEQALKELGIPHVVEFACDKDKYAKQTYQANHEAKIFYDDIVSRDHEAAPGVDLYCFGFPCQAFSNSGNRGGFDDIRGTLVFNSADYIRKHQPAVFLAENVKGLLSHDKPKGSKEKYGRTFNRILSLFASRINGVEILHPHPENLGYSVFFGVLNSKYYDVPQNRERVFIIGFRDHSINFQFPNSKVVSKSLKDILEPVVDRKYYLTDKMLACLEDRKEKNEAKGNGFAACIKHENDIASCLMAGYHKMRGDQDYFEQDEVNFIGYVKDKSQAGMIYDARGISPAIMAGSQGYAMGFIKETPDQGSDLLVGRNIRRYTPLECMRLQGFPDSFIKPCSDTQIYKQAGNSISVTVLKAIFQNMKLDLI